MKSLSNLTIDDKILRTIRRLKTSTRPPDARVSYGSRVGWMERGEGGRISQLNFSGAISLSVYAELRRTLCGVMGRGLQTFLLVFAR